MEKKSTVEKVTNHPHKQKHVNEDQRKSFYKNYKHQNNKFQRFKSAMKLFT
jgi:hypothetical protein